MYVHVAHGGSSTPRNPMVVTVEKAVEVPSLVERPGKPRWWDNPCLDLQSRSEAIEQCWRILENCSFIGMIHQFFGNSLEWFTNFWIHMLHGAGIYTYSWVIITANVGIYSIHGASGLEWFTHFSIRKHGKYGPNIGHVHRTLDQIGYPKIGKLEHWNEDSN